MKRRFLNRPVALRCLAACILSLIYGILSGSFLLRFTDGLSIAAVLYLLAGVLVYWWKEGFFSFFTWKKEEGSFINYRDQVRQERAEIENPTLYAGFAMLGISLILTLLYTMIF